MKGQPALIIEHFDSRMIVHFEARTKGTERSESHYDALNLSLLFGLSRPSIRRRPTPLVRVHRPVPEPCPRERS